MLRLRQKPDNEWLRADRRERRRNVLVVVLILGAAIGAVALLIWSLV